MKIPDIIRRGRQAALFLSDPTFQDAVKEANDTFLKDWKLAETLDEREAAHARVIALEQVVKELGKFESNGQVEENKQKRFVPMM